MAHGLLKGQGSWARVEAPPVQVAAVTTVPDQCPRCRQPVRVEAPLDPKEPRRWACPAGHGGTIGIPKLDQPRRLYPFGRCQACGTDSGRMRFCTPCRRAARERLNER